MAIDRKSLNRAFPNLLGQAFTVTNDLPQEIDQYNCIAWAAEDKQNKWWPVGNVYWPPSATKAETIQAFAEAYATLGYKHVDNSSHETGRQKIALYVDANNIPTHAARQLSDGNWSSKLGESIEITHKSLSALEDGLYGKAIVFFERLLGPVKDC